MATIGLSNLYYAAITEDTAGNETYGEKFTGRKAEKIEREGTK